MTGTSIPYLIGITGHRDIHQDSIHHLEIELHTIFNKLKKNMPNCQIILLSPLAEGADRITARIALEEGLELVVPLPFEQIEYEKDFLDSSLEEFNLLLNLATKVYYVGNAPENLSGPMYKEAQYEYLGHHIADNCNLMIAVWDGIMLDKRGGTSKIVEYKRNDAKKNLYKNMNGHFLIHIPVKRSATSNNENADWTEHLTFESLGDNQNTDFEIIIKSLQHFDNFNNLIQIHNDDNLKQKKFIEKIHYMTDNIAIEYQKKYQKSVITMMWLSWLTLFFMQLLLIIKMNILVFFYVVLTINAYLYYHFWINKKNLKENFVFIRGICEALRFQIYWKKAGVKEKVSDYYLLYAPDFFWINNVLQNINYCSEWIFEETFEINHAELKNEWINGQLDYYYLKGEARKKDLMIAIKRAEIGYAYGAKFTILLAILFVVKNSIDYFGWNASYYDSLTFGYTTVLFLSAIFIASGAFISEKYIKFKEFSEDINSFQIMKKIYSLALAKYEIAAENKKWKVFFDLGKKALSENSRWVMLHNSKTLFKSNDKSFKPNEIRTFIKYFKF